MKRSTIGILSSILLLILSQLGGGLTPGPTPRPIPDPIIPATILDECYKADYTERVGLVRAFIERITADETDQQIKEFARSEALRIPTECFRPFYLRLAQATAIETKGKRLEALNVLLKDLGV